MNTQYLTVILRLRLNGRPSQETRPDKVNGSLQQVGLQELHYFDSAEKLQEALQQLVDRGTLPAQTEKESRKCCQPQP